MARRCNSVCCVLLVPSCLLAAAVLVALAVILPSTWPGLLRGIVDEVGCEGRLAAERLAHLCAVYSPL